MMEPGRAQSSGSWANGGPKETGCSQQGNAPPALPQVDFATSGGPETSLVSEQLPLLSRETVACSVMHRSAPSFLPSRSLGIHP